MKISNSRLSVNVIQLSFRAVDTKESNGIVQTSPGEFEVDREISLQTFPTDASNGVEEICRSFRSSFVCFRLVPYSILWNTDYVKKLQCL